jgi:hypothetical protein
MRFVDLASNIQGHRVNDLYMIFPSYISKILSNYGMTFVKSLIFGHIPSIRLSSSFSLYREYLGC